VSLEKTDKEKNAPAFELAFVTEDIEHTFATALKAGAILVKEPTQKPWGKRSDMFMIPMDFWWKFVLQ